MATEKRLIDAIALYQTMESNLYWGQDSDGAILDTIDEAPTVDAVEVVHGYWRYYSTTMQECSNCHRHTARHKFKYCPHCGAVMEDKYHDG